LGFRRQGGGMEDTFLVGWSLVLVSVSQLSLRPLVDFCICHAFSPLLSQDTDYVILRAQAW
jgi:hypothetical protein